MCYRFAGYVGVSPHGLTLAELWDMFHGKLSACRTLLVDQARLIWCSSSKEQIEEFIRTGFLDVTDGGSEPAMSYDVDALKAMNRQYGLDRTEG